LSGNKNIIREIREMSEKIPIMIRILGKNEVPREKISRLLNRKLHEFSYSGNQSLLKMSGKFKRVVRAIGEISGKFQGIFREISGNEVFQHKVWTIKNTRRL